MAETSGRRLPTDLGGAIRYFSDLEVANEYVASLLQAPDLRRRGQATLAGCSHASIC
jgi:hypothetical protein